MQRNYWRRKYAAIKICTRKYFLLWSTCNERPAWYYMKLESIISGMILYSSCERLIKLKLCKQ